MRVRGREALRSRAPLHSGEPPACLAQSAHPWWGGGCAAETEGQSELWTVVSLTAWPELMLRANWHGRPHTSPMLGPRVRRRERRAASQPRACFPAPCTRVPGPRLCEPSFSLGSTWASSPMNLAGGALGLTSSRTCSPARGNRPAPHTEARPWLLGSPQVAPASPLQRPSCLPWHLGTSPRARSREGAPLQGDRLAWAQT